MEPENRIDRSTSSARPPIEETVAVVIVNYRTPSLVKACLETVRQERPNFLSLSVLVVDGGSEDGSAEELSDFIGQSGFGEWVEFLPLAVNGGFGWANNQAILRLMSGAHVPAYIHLLNPDAAVEADAIWLLADYLNRHPRAGAVGSQLFDPQGFPSASAFVFPSLGTEFARGARTELLERLLGIPPISIDTKEAIEVDWVTGASVMFRVEALREAGLFDEGFFLYHEEVELMWRLRHAGWFVATEPLSRVRHVGGAATGIRDDGDGELVLKRAPAFLYRSRTRYFGLTRGRTFAALAFVAWLAGYAIWKLRQVLGIANRGKRVDRELRDHVIVAFPRKHDSIAAVTTFDSGFTRMPAWMAKRWL